MAYGRGATAARKAAEHLRTPKARAEYLSIVLADGDPAEVRDALNLVARAQGMSEVAKAAGVTREGLYKTLGAGGNPEFSTVVRVIGAMGNSPFGSGGGCKAEEAGRGVRRFSVAGRRL